MRYRSQVASGLLSRHRGHPSNYQPADGVAKRALNLIRDRYPDFGPTLACEKLRECHGLGLSKETVRHLMTYAGFWIPRGQRLPACTLLVFVDDATGRLMTLHFTATESTFSYFEVTRAHLEQHGKQTDPNTCRDGPRIVLRGAS